MDYAGRSLRCFEVAAGLGLRPPCGRIAVRTAAKRLPDRCRHHGEGAATGIISIGGRLVVADGGGLRHFKPSGATGPVSIRYAPPEGALIGAVRNPFKMGGHAGNLIGARMRGEDNGVAAPSATKHLGGKAEASCHGSMRFCPLRPCAAKTGGGGFRPGVCSFRAASCWHETASAGVSWAE